MRPGPSARNFPEVRLAESGGMPIFGGKFRQTMNPKTLQDTLDSLHALIDGWHPSGPVPALERDLALEKLRRLYDAIRALDVRKELPAEELPGTTIPANGASVKEAPAADASEEESPEVEVELLFDDEEAIGMHAAEESEEESEIEVELLYADGENGASEEAERPSADDGTAEEAALPEPMPASAVIPEPSASKETAPAGRSEAVHAEAPTETATEEPAAAIPAESSAGGTATAAPTETSVTAQPASADETAAPAGETDTEIPAAGLPAAEVPVQETTPEEQTTPEEAAEESAKARAAEEERAATPAEETATESAKEIPAADTPAKQPLAEASAARPRNATLFGPEPDAETMRHRHRQRILMSLYGPDPIPASKPAATAKEWAGIIAAESPARPNAAPSPQPARKTQSVREAASVRKAQPAAPAAPSAEKPSSAAESAFAEPLGLALDEIQLPTGAVLGEVINHDVQTLADTIPAPHDVASELSRREPVGDLRRAVGINDKFLMIRDLFAGDSAAYEATLTTLNALPDLDECMIWIAEHYTWNPDSDGARLLMDLLERKHA